MREFETEMYASMPPFGTPLFRKQQQPKNESFLDMLRFCLFPYFQTYTFCFFWLLLITFVFCYSLSYKNLANRIQDQFLRVSQAALFQLGQNYPFYIIEKFHYYRVLTCMVLFRNFYHFLSVGMGILTFGSFLEKIVGFKRCFVLVIFSGVLSIVASNLLNENASLESGTPICGVIGSLLAYFMIEKDKSWKNYPNEKNQMLLLVIIMLTILGALALQYSNVNILPQAFALAIGFSFHFADSGDGNLLFQRLLARIFLISLTAIVVLMFFFRAKPILVQI